MENIPGTSCCCREGRFSQWLTWWSAVVVCWEASSSCVCVCASMCACFTQGARSALCSFIHSFIHCVAERGTPPWSRPLLPGLIILRQRWAEPGGSSVALISWLKASYRRWPKSAWWTGCCQLRTDTHTHTNAPLTDAASAHSVCVRAESILCVFRQTESCQVFVVLSSQSWWPSNNVLFKIDSY